MVVVAVPASAVDSAGLIVPAGVNTSVHELSGLDSSSAGPCQAPCSATTHPSGSGWLSVRSTEVAAPSVDHQACTAPLMAKVKVLPAVPQSFALPARVLHPVPLQSSCPCSPPLTRPPFKSRYSS